jgi:integrase
MARRNHIPSYRIHKQSGQAIVTLTDAVGRRRDVLLGKHGTPESRAEYLRVLAEWEAGGRTPPRSSRPTPRLSVNELILRYWSWASRHYRDADGAPTRELENLRDAIKPLRALYGRTDARDFGPLALRAVQEHMARSGLSRGVVNARVNRVRRLFKWAASYEVLPASLYEALRTVPGLSRGRGEVREAGPVRPVPVEDVEATLPLLQPPVAAMVGLQLLTGCRAGEAMAMRAEDLDRSGSPWCWRPRRHKNSHRGHERVLFLGPQAQAVVRPFLRLTCPLCGATDLLGRLAWRGQLCGPCADRCDEAGIFGPWPSPTPAGDYYLFSPREYVADLHARRAANRKTKRTPSEEMSRRKAHPKRRPAERYNRRSYRQAVLRACEKAGVPPWSPLQLRHTTATRIRSRYGVEVARVILGHTRVETSQIYAERDLDRAAEVMGEIG